MKQLVFETLTDDGVSVEYFRDGSLIVFSRGHAIQVPPKVTADLIEKFSKY